MTTRKEKKPTKIKNQNIIHEYIQKCINSKLQSNVQTADMHHTKLLTVLDVEVKQTQALTMPNEQTFSCVIEIEMQPSMTLN